MFGNRAIGSWTIATTPRITMMIEITIATIGRLMKNFAIMTRAKVTGANQRGSSGNTSGLRGHHAVFSGVSSNGLGSTVMPAFTFCSPSTTTRSPGCSP